MFHKAIVMEIKDEYVLALDEEGQIVRLVLKDGLQVGQKIYYVDEDIYEKDMKDTTAWWSSKSFKQGMLACLTVLFIGLSVFLLRPIPTYATVSFDGNRSLQVTLDKNLKVQEAFSFDDSISKEDLESMANLSLEDLKRVYENEDFVLIGYTLHEYNVDEDEELHNFLLNTFSENGPKILSGSSQDLQSSLQEKKNLGIYILDQLDDEFEDLFDDFDMDDLEWNGKEIDEDEKEENEEEEEENEDDEDEEEDD